MNRYREHERLKFENDVDWGQRLRIWRNWVLAAGYVAGVTAIGYLAFLGACEVVRRGLGM